MTGLPYPKSSERQSCIQKWRFCILGPWDYSSRYNLSFFAEFNFRVSYGAPRLKKVRKNMVNLYRRTPLPAPLLICFFHILLVLCSWGVLRWRFTLSKFSKAPHLRSSIPHSKTSFSRKTNCLPKNNPTAEIKKTPFIFRNKIGIPTISGSGAPSFRIHFSGNVLAFSLPY